MRARDRCAGIGSKIYVTLLYAALLGVLSIYQSNFQVSLLLGEYGYPVVYLLFVAASLVLFFWVGAVDPGYVQRQDVEGGVMLDDVATMGEVDDDMEGDVEASAAGGNRYCTPCKQDMPLRTKHCKKCGRCVGRFDHHCFFIGNCVGEKNHNLFWWFLFVETITSLWTIKLVVSCFRERPSISEWFYYNSFALVGLILLVGMALVPIGLWVLHTYLLFTNQTTWELLNRKQITYLKNYDVWVFPFSQGCFSNIRAFCCALPSLSGKWKLPEQIAEEQRCSLFSSRNHDCC